MIKINRAIVVEGRDDVAAVSRACEALIIPTHGYGISSETWRILEKAYREKGLIILTDPDHAGEGIRRRLTERFPGALQCYLTRAAAADGDDIGIENAAPEVIEQALVKTLRAAERREQSGKQGSAVCAAEGDSGRDRPAEMADLIELGLAGAGGAASLREQVSEELGIGHCNARAMVTRLRGFDIGVSGLAETVDRIRKRG